MKNVGILTIHAVYNYGAMLQAFALQTYISKNYECHVEIIDYRPYSVYKAYKLYWLDLVRDPRRFLRTFKRLVLSRGQFDRFIKFDQEVLKKSIEKYAKQNDLLSMQYDLVISGSDQIWNPLITDYDESFLLPFGSIKHRSAFSSSIGIADVDVYWEERLLNNLKNFDIVAVREGLALDYIGSKYICDKLYKVLDPVFLIDAPVWLDLADNELTPEEPYLLVYSLELNENIRFSAELLARRHELKIVAIHPFEVASDWVDTTIVNAGPREFISLVKNARYVVTNSFHGVSFSIIFGKDLVSFPHSSTGSRILDLIDNLGLSPVADNGINIYPTSSVSSVVSERVEYSKSILNKIFELL